MQSPLHTTSLIVGFLLMAFSGFSMASKTQKTIPTLDSVELTAYLGLWYEVSRIENDFQDNEPKPGSGPCFNTTAEYTILPNEKIEVKNTCYRTTGKEVAKAKAKVVPGSNNAKLKVNFTGVPFFEWLGLGDADYWILGLGEKNSEGLYSWALVGSPSLKFGWILSRTTDLSAKDVESALQIAESLGYDRQLFKFFRK